MTYSGKWHGKKYYFGFHYDLHANEKDTNLGTRCGTGKLASSLKLMGPDFVQTDCKGCPGMTSWFSKVPTATVSPGTKKDALKSWRKATRKLGLPLHCHYSGLWDSAAGKKYPDWCIVKNPEKEQDKRSLGRAVMCPRSPYVEELVIPQFLELIDRYEVDGFWVDADIWAAELCYCKRCKAAFKEKTGISKPPVDVSDPNWVTWFNFHRESFEEYVTSYCNAVHEHKPGVLVCSNWLQAFKHPGEPKVPTDWISGDVTPHTSGIDDIRCEARFISTRGKPWDLMPWDFSRPENIAQPVQMLQQRVSVILSMGGNVQIYDHPPKLRDGRLISWRMKRLGGIGKFVRARKSLCQGSETIPQVAVLYSESHYYSQPVTNRADCDTSYITGAVFSLLENSYSVDIMDEWALLPRLQEFPIVVSPEQGKMSETAVKSLKDYVTNGGRLVLSGAAAYNRFGSGFLGVKSIGVKKNITYHVPADDGSFGLLSKTWRLLKTTSARSVGVLGETPLLDEELLPYPAATMNKVGRGLVTYIPCDLFHFFNENPHPLVRSFIGGIVRKLRPKFDIKVSAPSCVDVILRQKSGKKIVHLINRASGLANQPRNGVVDEIPVVGPLMLEMKVGSRPRKISLVFEEGKCPWKYVPAGGRRKGGIVSAVISTVHIHSALVVE